MPKIFSVTLADDQVHIRRNNGTYKIYHGVRKELRQMLYNILCEMGADQYSGESLHLDLWNRYPERR